MEKYKVVNRNVRSYIEQALKRDGVYVSTKGLFIVDMTSPNWEENVDGFDRGFELAGNASHSCKATGDRYVIFDIEYAWIDSSWKTLEEVFISLVTVKKIF